jgi:hypothetical protein
MQIKSQCLGFVVLILAAFTSPVVGQTYSCAADTATATVNLRDYVLRLTGSDPSLDSTRMAYHLPLASANQVRVATQANTCKSAAQAYHAAVRGRSEPQISRSVVVIKVGVGRYVVVDPAERAGEFEVTVILNGDFQPLASFNS